MKVGELGTVAEICTELCKHLLIHINATAKTYSYFYRKGNNWTYCDKTLSPLIQMIPHLPGLASRGRNFRAHPVHIHNGKYSEEILENLSWLDRTLKDLLRKPTTLGTGGGYVWTPGHWNHMILNASIETRSKSCSKCVTLIFLLEN